MAGAIETFCDPHDVWAIGALEVCDIVDADTAIRQVDQGSPGTARSSPMDCLFDMFVEPSCLERDSDLRLPADAFRTALYRETPQFARII
jgi:hypothetical protein